MCVCQSEYSQSTTHVISHCLWPLGGHLTYKQRCTCLTVVRLHCDKATGPQKETAHILVRTCYQGTGSLQRTCRGKGREWALHLVWTLYRRPRRSTPDAGYEPYAPSELKQQKNTYFFTVITGNNTTLVFFLIYKSCLLCNENYKWWCSKSLGWKKDVVSIVRH